MTEATRKNSDWLRPALLVSFGGMLYVLAALCCTQWIAAYLEDGRLIDPQVKFNIMWIVLILGLLCFYWYFRNRVQKTDPQNWVLVVVFSIFAIQAIPLNVTGEYMALAAGLLSMSILFYIGLALSGVDARARKWLLSIWLAGYLLLWVFTYAQQGMSLPLFLFAWLGTGVVAGLLSLKMYASTAADAASYASSEQANRPSGPGGSSGSLRRQNELAIMHRHAPAPAHHYGRVPLAVSRLVAELVKAVTGPILKVLPISAPAEIREFTLRRVLDAVLRDWWQNRNFDGLQEADIADLKSFIVLSVHFGGGMSNQRDQFIYCVCLKALLDDWVENWNSDGSEGAPKRS